MRCHATFVWCSQFCEIVVYSSDRRVTCVRILLQPLGNNMTSMFKGTIWPPINM